MFTATHKSCSAKLIGGCLGLASMASIGMASETVRLLPETFTLSGPEARQSLILEAFSDTRAVGELRDSVALVSSDPAVVRIEDGRAVPVADGHATITATAGDRTSTSQVTVAEMAKPFAWSFRNHVE
jgi:hypothetical protein